ncbi:transcriptional regulator SlyA [Desulfosporosinus acididurans]|uniref:Transcriptional regulator SlyA n=1 Tax=Desulfosporosinus acididurans TaxID=476652 RepID=A0A0J1FLY2_9FIRM|nr:MarR family transcriptional regulator [Desulfosporosinus acididurans]KLU64382.1 transcriptional regulator SlyA [Desulfosporosinus acididurans]
MYMFTTYDESVGQLTNQTNKLIMRYLNSKLELYDITLEQWIVLLKLSQQDKITQKKLAENVDKDQPTLARILDILERKKLVERKPNEKDRRAFSVQMTEKGINLKKHVTPLLENLFATIVEGISDEEMETYKRVLLKINRNITIQEKVEK